MVCKSKANARRNTSVGSIDGLDKQTLRSVVDPEDALFFQPCQSSLIQTRNMMYNRNKTQTGGSFSDATIEAVWQKAKPLRTRLGCAKDDCDAIIRRASYGMTSEFGWEIDHIHPKSKGGSDALRNLQPLHWENNRAKGDKYPNWQCARRR